MRLSERGRLVQVPAHEREGRFGVGGLIDQVCTGSPVTESRVPTFVGIQVVPRIDSP